MDATITALIAAGSSIATVAIQKIVHLVVSRGKQAIETRRLNKEEKREEREDTLPFLTRAWDMSDAARKQIELWLAEEREARKRCEKGQEELRNRLLEVEYSLKRVSEENRDLKLHNDRLDMQLQSLRETLVRDYARRPESLIPGYPPDHRVDTDKDH